MLLMLVIGAVASVCAALSVISKPMGRFLAAIIVGGLEHGLGALLGALGAGYVVSELAQSEGLITSNSHALMLGLSIGLAFALAVAVIARWR